MSDQKAYISIDSRRFVLYDNPIDLYHKNGTNFLIYNGNRIPLNIPYDFPEIMGEKVPISIKYNPHMLKIQVRLAEYITYEVTNNQNSSVITGGDSDYIYLESSTGIIYYFRSGNGENKFELKVHFESVDDSSDYSKDEIRNSVEYMYSDNNEDIRTIKKDESYSLDIDMLLNLDQLEGINKIGYGGYRRAFNIKDATSNLEIHNADGDILKVASNRDGIKTNKREFQTWQAVKGTELEKYFCPITNRDPNYRYIIMRNASKDRELTNDQVERLKSNIKQNISEDIVDIPGVHKLDIRSGNIGIYDGRKVLIDYPYGGSLS